MAEEERLLAVDQGVLETSRSEIQRYKELSARAHAGYDVPESIKGGCSIELGHRGLTRLPAELIDVIKDDADRLALDRNRLTGLSGLGPRFAECTRLRYLVMRNNSLRDFPLPVRRLPHSSLPHEELLLRTILDLVTPYHRGSGPERKQNRDIARGPVSTAQPEDLFNKTKQSYEASFVYWVYEQSDLSHNAQESN